MLAYVIRRLAQLPIILAVIYTITFLLICQHPGDPFIGDKTPQEQRQLIQARYGISDSKVATYFTFVDRLVRHGDLGLSSQFTNWSVNDIIGATLPASVLLGAFALSLAVIVGCTLGIVAAVRSHGPVDYAVMVYALLGISLPLFVIAAMLLAFFAFKLAWFPVGGWGTPEHLVLPGVSLSLPFTAYIARLMRAGMLDVLGADHIRTARAKGLPPSQVVLKHAFKQAFLPVVSFLGPATASVLTGSFVVEKIFNVPGMGQAFVQAVTSKDYALILGAVLVYSTLLVAANLVVDLSYQWLDPRIHLEGSA